MTGSIGLIAGNGRFPQLFALGAREQGLKVIAVGHRGETDPVLESMVDAFTWVRVGQVNRILDCFHRAQVTRAVMAGGIGKLRALAEARPDLGALRIISRLRTLRDDALLRGVATYLEEHGVTIAAPTDYVKRLLAPSGPLAGPELTPAQARDVALGVEVAAALGSVDVGQTVVLLKGNVLALEAAEGTDEAIRRGARLGGPGAVVVKLCKPGQDFRFDLPAVGTRTLAVMAECKAAAIAVESGRTVLLDGEELFVQARSLGISVLGVERTVAGSAA